MNDKTHRDPELVKRLIQWLGEGHQALAELVNVLHSSIDELEQNNRCLTQQIADLTAQRDTLDEKYRAQSQYILQLEEKNQAQVIKIRELEEMDRSAPELQPRADGTDQELEHGNQMFTQNSDRRDEPDCHTSDLTKQLENASAETYHLQDLPSEPLASVDTHTTSIEEARNENIIGAQGFSPSWQDMLAFLKKKSPKNPDQHGETGG